MNTYIVKLFAGAQDITTRPFATHAAAFDWAISQIGLRHTSGDTLHTISNFAIVEAQVR